MQKKLKLNGSMMTSRNTTKKDVLFIIGDWNVKVGSQEIPGVTGNFGLGEQNEEGQRLTECRQEKKNTGHSKHPLPSTRDDSIHGHHQMVNTKIRLIIFFGVKDGDTLYSQQKQELKVTVAQIMNFLLQN